MLSVNTAQFPEIVALYPRQIELEDTIQKIVCQQQGIKESHLWLMVLAEMAKTGTGPALTLVAGTVRRMIERGKLTGIDFIVSGCGDTFVLPANACMQLVPNRVDTGNLSTILHPRR